MSTISKNTIVQITQKSYLQNLPEFPEEPEKNEDFSYKFSCWIFKSPWNPWLKLDNTVK